MPDQPDKKDQSETESAPTPVAGGKNADRPVNGKTAMDGDDSRRNQKRRGPIVNRRGPSEISRAIKNSQAMAGNGAAPRRISEGSLSRGTVIRIDKEKGFGFIMDAAGQHRFFHRTSVLENGFGALTEQQSVEFEAHTDERGERAVKVRPASAQSRTPRAPEKPASPANVKGAATRTWKSDLSPFRNGSGAPTAGRKRYLV